MFLMLSLMNLDFRFLPILSISSLIFLQKNLLSLLKKVRRTWKVCVSKIRLTWDKLSIQIIFLGNDLLWHNHLFLLLSDRPYLNIHRKYNSRHRQYFNFPSVSEGVSLCVKSFTDLSSPIPWVQCFLKGGHVRNIRLIELNLKLKMCTLIFNVEGADDDRLALV